VIWWRTGFHAVTVEEEFLPHDDLDRLTKNRPLHSRHRSMSVMGFFHQGASADPEAERGFLPWVNSPSYL
jgi:hypothetical protein